MRRLQRALTVGVSVGSLVAADLLGLAAEAEEVPNESPVGVAGFPAPSADPPPARKLGPSEVTGPAASTNAMRSGRLSCGQSITQSTTLTADIGPCPGNGLIVGADNIILNLNGHTILGAAGPGDGNAAGIRLPNRTGVWVTGLPGGSGKTGTVAGFDAGVFINGGSANRIENLTLTDNVGPANRDSLLGDGIAVFNSARNTIQRNFLERNGIYDGIGVLGNDAHENTVRDNVVRNTVALIDPTGPAGNGTGAGIVIDAFLDAQTGKLIRGNQVLGNTVQFNDGPGISNVNTQDGRVSGNTVEDNGHVQSPGNGIGVQVGLFPESTEGRMILENNVIRRNGGTGVYTTSDLNQVRGNTIEDNGFQPPRDVDPFGGIFMSVNAIGGGVIENNVVRRNGGLGHGIQLSAVDRANGGVTGQSHNNRIQGNTVSDHRVTGIMLLVTGGTNYVISNYVVNTRRIADLVDGGGAFGFYSGCSDNVWFDNTYERAVPECAAAGGHQVSVA